jgi:Calcineurin-like phosphoesterase
MPSEVPRHIFIGDVHGCLDELRALLTKLSFRPKDDVVVLVGDLVAKGPDSAGVVAFAREMGLVAVRGNHDDAVMRVQKAQRRGHPLERARPGHLRVARALRDVDAAWLDALPLYLTLPVFNALVVHAGVVPGLPVERQKPADLLTMRALTPHGQASPRLEDGVQWVTRYSGPEHVIFGHDALSGLQRTAFASGLDTGCVYGRELTALILPENKLVSVPARRAYKELGP